MRIAPTFHNSIILALILACSTSVIAQDPTDPDSISKNSFTWSPEVLEYGFLHYDEIYTGREVAHGDNVYELKQGPPIAAFSEGGEKEEVFSSFVTDEKVAGLLILQSGEIRLEYYNLGYSEDGRWTSQSVAKSVTSTLVGAAINDGYINSVDDLVTDYIPDLKGSAYDSVTIHQMLTMTSGVKWIERSGDGYSDLANFFQQPIEPGMDETVSYMRSLPADAAPGEKWLYKTGETHLLGSLVTTATGQTLADYLSSKIWAPYGMEEKAMWTLGRTGQELAGCCLQAKLRDFARFGQFVLDDGMINGESIVPEGWFDAATSMQVSLWPGWGYGYQWWARSDGTFHALGIHGQMIHIDPARQLVVVINSAWPEAESYGRQMAASGFINTLTGVLDKEVRE